MKSRVLLTVGLVIVSLWCSYGIEKSASSLDNLVKVFEQNPSNPVTAVRLLEELSKQGKSGKEVLERYFKTQTEADYLKDYNWAIVRDYVNDIHAPQLKYVFENYEKFIQQFSKDDVYQKLDNVLVSYLEELYWHNKIAYEQQMKKIREVGYEHYDVVYDYFNIRELRASRNAEDYFYKARKLFRYFPENRKLIKEITAGALEIMNDVSRLKVIQLWAGKTVESRADFEAVYNYVRISQKCGFNDVARKYAQVADRLAAQSNNPRLKEQAGELKKMLN